MIRLTFEEAIAFARPDGLPRYEADLFWRAARLIRRAAGEGGDPDALIAVKSEDLQPGSDLLTQLGLEGRLAEDLLERASRVRYTLRLHCYEVDVKTPHVIALLPRDMLTEGLKAELRLGHAPVVAVPHTALCRELDVLKARGARVQWARVRVRSDLDAPGFDLRVRVRGGQDCREIRTRLPLSAFSNTEAVSEYLGETVGEGICLV